MATSAEPKNISRELDAWIRTPKRGKAEAEHWYQVLRRKIDPTDPDYSPRISQKELARASGEDEASVSRKLKQWTWGISDASGRLVVPPRCKAALAPKKPGPPKNRVSVPDAVEQEILDKLAELLRTRGTPEPAPIKDIHRYFESKAALTKEQGPTFAQVRYIVRRYYRDAYQDVLAAAGGIPELQKQGGLPRMVVPQPDAPNLEWILDQWVADVFVLFEDGELHRPTIVSLVDRYGGGFVLGMSIHRRFTGFTVAEAVTDAILRNGKPQALFLDLGRENRTKYLKDGCLELGTKLIHTTPHDPAVKGLMEQTHGAYRRICKTLPYYAPSDIKTKPIRDQEPLRFAEFCERFQALVYGGYNQEPYTGMFAQGAKSRLQIRTESDVRPVIPAEQELRILFAQAKKYTVWSQGVKVHGIFYGHPTLHTRIGQEVWGRQGRVDTGVIIHDLGMQFLCVATNQLAETAQMDDAARREFTSDRRELVRAKTALANERIRRSRSKEDYVLHRAQQRMAAQDETPTRTPVRQLTRVTGQTPEAAARPARKFKLFRYSS